MQKEILIDNLVSIWQEKEIIKPLPAEGRSMYPLIKHGDTIYIKFCRPEKVKAGDIIAFKRGSTTIVHRLLKKSNSAFLEKGDFQIRGQFIESRYILGKVILGNNCINCLMSHLGYLVHRFSFIGRPLLVFPLTINTFFVIIHKNADRNSI